MRIRTTTLARGALFAGAALALVSPARAACSSSDLSGSYSTIFSGFIGPNSPLNAEAFLTANGSGGLVGTMSVAEFGFIKRNFTVNGSYSISGNCVGSATISASPIGTIHFDFSVSHKGKAFVGVETDHGTSVSVNGTRY